MGGAKASSDFEEDFVDGFSFGDGTVDDFAVNVIVDDDVLFGTVLFVAPGYIERREPPQEAEDFGGDFQHVSMHATRPRSPQQDNPDCRNCN
jgi:hypothetical protein